MKRISVFLAGLAALAAAACGAGERRTAPPPAASAPDAGALLDAAIDGPHRTPEERARDQWRHPRETLAFFGVTPTMTVVEVWPGGGWYTKILAPYLRAGGGEYIAAHVDPDAGARAAAVVEEFRREYAAEETYGAIRVTILGGKEGVAPAGSADVVLSFRNVHNWIASDEADAHFAAFHAALKPGGVLGIVEHRADEAATENAAATGYVKESTVKALAENAGFIFAGSSEINANPADTKDHPFGVWTLPPVRRSAISGGQEDPAFDHAKYEAIGESDRMTLKFRKAAQ